MPINIELTPSGHLHLPAEVAEEHFPNESVVALVREPEMWRMPTHSASSGGFLLKRRNGRGDRTVLLWEVLGTKAVARDHLAFWDEAQGALRIALEGHHG